MEFFVNVHSMAIAAFLFTFKDKKKKVFRIVKSCRNHIAT